MGLIKIVFVMFVFFAIIGALLPKTDSPSQTTTSARTVSRPTPAPPPRNTWRISQRKSSMDDSYNVYLTLESHNSVRGTFGDIGTAQLNIRCVENTTSILFNFNDQFMSDVQNYGQITYRVDSNNARTKRFQESTNNKWLGLWSGGQAIPFVKGLFGGEELLVRATPFNESSIEVLFPIKGIEDRITALRTACHW